MTAAVQLLFTKSLHSWLCSHTSHAPRLKLSPQTDFGLLGF